MQNVSSEPPPDRSAETARRWLAAAGVCGMLLALNFLGGWFVDLALSLGNDLLFLSGWAWTGLIVAEIALLSAGVVFAIQPFWQRLAWHWLAAIALFGAWFAGYFSSPSSRAASWQESVAFLVGLSLIGLAVQMPLWPLRLFFGWRVGDPQATHSADERRPLSIRDLLIATAVVGAYAAAARGAATEDNANHWWTWGIACLYYAGASALSLPPLLYWLLRLKSAGRGVAFSGLYTLAWAGGMFALLYALSPPALGQFGLMPILIWPCVIVGYGFSLTVVLAVARACGYRLEIAGGKLASGSTTHC